MALEGPLADDVVPDLRIRERCGVAQVRKYAAAGCTVTMTDTARVTEVLLALGDDAGTGELRGRLQDSGAGRSGLGNVVGAIEFEDQEPRRITLARVGGEGDLTGGETHGAAPTEENRHVLFAVDLVGHRRGEDSGVHRHRPQ